LVEMQCDSKIWRSRMGSVVVRMDGTTMSR
jgi:hypothetical protein